MVGRRFCRHFCGMWPLESMNSVFSLTFVEKEVSLVAAQTPPVFGRRRAHTSAERLADGCVHVLGLICGLVGGIFLIVLALGQGNSHKVTAISVYAIALLAMLAASAAFNMFYGTRFRDLLQRCDHSAIFIMIAGTYTPFTTQFFGTTQALAWTAAIWMLCLSSIALKIVRPDWFERCSVVLYLLSGWIGVLMLWPLLATLPMFDVLALMAGGLLYTCGVTFHVWENLPFQNVIWHVFVLAAASCHYCAVLDGVVLRDGPA